MGRIVKILVFDTYEQARAALGVVDQIAAAWWVSQGYTVDAHGLIPKTIAGDDSPHSCRTTTWADVMESPNNKFYFISPSSDARFIDWRDHVPPEYELPQDTDFPEDWRIVYNT